MVDLGRQLLQDFKDWDRKDSGTIPVEMLQAVLLKLNPSFTDREIKRLLNVVDSEGSGVIKYSNFVDFVTCDKLTSVAGPALPNGMDSDSKLSRFHDCIEKVRDPRPGLKSWMQDMRELLDPHQNSAGYKLCQNAALSAKVEGPLLMLTQKIHSGGLRSAPLLEKDSDAIRSLAWEILARLAFANEEGSEAVCKVADLVPFMAATLHAGIAPEQLSALQLVQALATSSSASCNALVPTLLVGVVPLLSKTSFQTLQEAVFDILVCSSRSHAAAVVAAVGWPQLAAMTVEGEGRPAWLPTDPLQTFLCGRMAVDLLSGAPAPEEAEALAARDVLHGTVSSGSFLDLFTECLEAAVARREWPLGTEAYHAADRLADFAAKLCHLGHVRKLLPAVKPLARAVEAGAGDQTSKAALRALRELAKDVACLRALLGLEAFRTETLEMLHKSGDEPEATELLSYMESVELSFMGAESLLNASRAFVHHAPSVDALAETFARCAPLDKEMTALQVLQAAPEIPLPGSLLKADKAVKGNAKFSFKALAEHVYGTPTILGWWPSLMEDSAAHLQQLGEVQGLPDLVHMVQLFEDAAGGRSVVGAEAVLAKVLPATSLPREGAVVEGELSALGARELDFKAFVQWLGSLCTSLENSREEEEAAAAVEAAAAAAEQG